MLEKMTALISTKNRADLQTELLEEYTDMEKEVGEIFTGKTKHTVQTMYKKQRDYIIELFKRVDKALEGCEWHKEVVEKIEDDLQLHREAIAKDMSIDFDANISDHDLIRNKMRYIKNLLQFPVKTIEEEEKKRAAAESESPNTEADINWLDTPAEDTAFTG